MPPDIPGHEPRRETLVFESDWLASKPFFYNLKSGRASHNINDVVDLANIEFDPEGFNDFLDWGFSVFERTPLRDVRLLRYSSRLYSGPDGLRVEYLDDPAWAWLERQSTVDEVLEVASAKVNAAAAGDGEIVVPTSGGLDSRLLNVLIRDRRRVRSFTYGVSDDPSRSFEAVKARELARRLGIRWELIPLGDFHRYFDDWDALYGVSTHAHGMYQIEFYRHVLTRVEPGSVVLSGAAGESFAGQGSEDFFHDTVDSLADFYADFRWGEMNADSSLSQFNGARLGIRELLEAHPRLRTEPLPRVFAALRLRLTLLSYLLIVPASVGLRPQAPYLDIDLAMRMLTLPADQRWARRWQREFFARQGVDLESRHLPGDYRNTLNFRAMRREPLKPLDVALLREVVKPEYVRWVNRNVGLLGLPSEALWRLGWTPGFRRAAKLMAPTGIAGRRMRAYCAYLTLKPIESLLQRRDRARRGAESP
jgi:asparagine synthetase B (glutamine-hydrolysing)